MLVFSETISIMKPKRKESTVEVREIVINMYNNKKSYREIARTVNLATSTVHSIVKKYKLTGEIVNKLRKGRPRVLSDRDERFIMQKIRQNPKNSAPKIASTLSKELKKMH